MSAQSANISVAALGDNTIVAGVPGYAIEVKGYVLTGAAAVIAKWMSDVGGPAVALGTLTLTAGQLIVVAPGLLAGEKGWFQTAAGKALNLNLGTAVSVTGHVLYELIAQ